jgi:hypothetical protein
MAEKDHGFLHEVFGIFLRIAIVVGAVALLGVGVERL